MNSRLPAFIVAAALWLVGTTASPSTGLNQYQITFEQIPSPNLGRTLTILRDNRGFLWLGTSKGLCRYDGYRLRVFPIGDPLVAEQQVVTSIVRMDSGSLLLATWRGAWTFDLRTERCSPFLPEAGISRSRINTIIAGPESTIWIGTRSQGLLRYSRITGAIQSYATRNGLSSDNIRSLLFDRSGRLWIGTFGGGLNMLDRSTSHVDHFRSNSADRETLLSDRIMALCENEDQELWIGTTGGLNVLNLETQQMKRISLQSYTRHSIMAIVRDPSGRMWVAAMDLGVLFFAHGVFTPLTLSSDAGRTLSSVGALYADPVASTRKSLLLWTGTRSGITKVLMVTNPFTNHIRNRDSLQLDRGAVLSLCEDRKGILWVGLWGGGLNGLQRVNGRYRRIAAFESDPLNRTSLPDDDVGTVIEDRNGNLWLGTAGGLAMLDKYRKHMVVYRHSEKDSTGLLNSNIEAIYEDRSGTLWVCTHGGLSELIHATPPHFRNYLLDPKQSDPVEGRTVSNILQDRQSNLWVATYGRGLNRLEANGKHTRFLHPEDSVGTRENWIHSLVEDHEGLFWLSTRVGLVSFDPRSGRFTRRTIEQLSGAFIFGIFVDRMNDLWLSTEIGLAKYSPRTSSFTRIDRTYGILFAELLSGFHEGTHGNLFVGGLDGFTEFSPESVSAGTHTPEIAITSISIFDMDLPASVLATGEIRCTYDQNFLSFSFAALDYANPMRNRFAYRMLGVDKSWIEAGTRNYASYTNLDPGEYVFQVRGSNSNDVWNEAGKSISVSISPPYWRTWWFRIAVLGCIVIAMYTAYRYRLHKLLEVERLRLRIANDLHDDIGSNLSSIAMVARAIHRTPELTQETRRRLAEIYETAVATAGGMREIVWFIKPENDTLDQLLLRMKDTASSLLGNIDHVFHMPKDRNSNRISVDFKRNFFLAFKEILTNIVKHASATEVDIQVEQLNGKLEIIIRDNGRGFDEGAIRRGNGLGSLRNRAHNIGGMCEITTRSGNGTTVRFWGNL